MLDPVALRVELRSASPAPGTRANGLDDASGVQDHFVMEPVFESTWLEQNQEPTGSRPGQIPFLLWMCGNAGGTACGARRRIAPTFGW